MLWQSLDVLPALHSPSRRTVKLALLALVLPELTTSPVQDARFEAARGALLAGIATPRGCSLLSVDSRVSASRRPVFDEEDIASALPARRWALRGTARYWAAQAGLASSRSPSLAGRDVSLLATSSAREVDVHKFKKEPLPADWFGDFSQSESTWHTDGVNARPGYPEQQSGEDVAYARTVAEEDRVSMPTAKPEEWFQETESAGSKQAWQTYYPSVGNFRSRDQQLAPWRGSAEGTFQEAYEPDEKVQDLYSATKAKGPEWFDSSVSQYDAFGRGKLPSMESSERYVEFTERTRNVTFACKDPGCEVNASLKVFDHGAEVHQDCTLTVRAHPTDFDDEFSREYIELVSLNGRALNFRCSPQAEVRSCGAGGEDRLAHCLKDFPLDRVVGHSGMLHISARISSMVDECPVKGNLLSAMAIVTCKVHPSWMNQPKNETGDWKWSTTTRAPDAALGRLQCKEPNCSATVTMFVDPQVAVNKTCRLTISMAETDFDGNLGSLEEVEWVKVDGQHVQAFTQPSRNPCKERLKALQNLTDDGSNSSNKSSKHRHGGGQTKHSHGNSSHDGSNNNSSHGSKGGDQNKSSSGHNSSGGSGDRGQGNKGGDHNKSSSGHSNSSTGHDSTAGNHSKSDNSTGHHSNSGDGHGSKGSHNNSSSGNGSSHSSGSSQSSHSKGQSSGNGDFSGAQLHGPNSTSGDSPAHGSNASSAEKSTASSAGGGDAGDTNASGNATGDGSTQQQGKNNSASQPQGIGGGGIDSASTGLDNASFPNVTATHPNSGQGTDSASNTSADGLDNVTFPNVTAAINPTDGHGSRGNTSNATPSVVNSVFGNAFGNLHSHETSTATIPDTVYGDEGTRFGHAQFILLNRSDVTSAALDGKVTISVKITDMVDECGTEEGYLLDAQAMIECT